MTHPIPHSTLGTSSMHRALRRLGRFPQAADGAAAVEFAIILPVMALLYLGTTEVTTLLMMDRKVTIATHMMSDIMGRSSKLDPQTLEQVVAVGNTILAPFDASDLTVTITSVVVREVGGNGKGPKAKPDVEARVCWSRKSKGRGKALGHGRAENELISTLPAGFDVPGMSFTLTEVENLYKPMVGDAITGEIRLTEIMAQPARGDDQVEYDGKKCPTGKNS